MLAPRQDCLDDETIARLLARDLDAAAAASVEAHLDRCADCRRHVSDLVRQAPAARKTLGGRYVVLGTLGRGGMGEVFEAYDPELGRRVAVKLLHVGGEAEAARTRLRREAQAMARLQHPNVVAVYDLGLDGDRVFIAMELVDGTTLAAWATDATPADRLAACIDAGRGLAAAHAVGLVHRDVTPRNVLVGKDRRARVTDFGLVRIVGDRDDAPPESLPSPALDHLTRTGAFVGTPVYAAPEVFEGKPADERSDQWSWAATTWHVLYGEPPFVGRDFAELADAITHRRISESAGTVSPRIRKALSRAMSLDPAARYPSIDALVDEVARTPRRAVWIASGLLAASVATIGVVAFSRSDGRTCARGDVSDPWNPEHALALRRAFEATGSPIALDQAQRVTQAFDAYAARWAIQRLAACEDTHSPELRALRERCLDDRLVSLRALRDELEHSVDQDALGNAVAAALSLPALETCADTAALARKVRPADPILAARLDLERARIARIDALAAVGRYDEALQLARSVATATRAPALASLLPEALYVLGDAEDSTGDPQAAKRTIQEAGLVAANAHDDAAVARAWLQLLYVTAAEEQNAQEASSMLPVVTAAVARAGNRDIEARFECVQGSVFGTANKRDEARAHTERCVDLLVAAHGADHLDVATAQANLAAVLGEQGKSDEAQAAATKALATFTKLLGPEHPSVARLLANRGRLYADAGNFAEAERTLRDVLAMQQRIYPAGHHEIGWTHRDFGRMWFAQREFTKAREAYERALPIFEHTTGATSGHVATLLVQIGATLVEDGRCGEATPRLERGIELVVSAFGDTSTLLVDPLTRLAECRAATDRPAAIALVERALRLIDDAGDPLNNADYRFRAARVLATNSALLPRARELAAAARAAYTTHSDDHADVERVDRWRATH